MTANLSKVYFLDNWSIGDEDPDPYKPPELRKHIAQGNVRGHPRFEDGEHIITSRIVEYDYPNRTIRTKNSTYRLGKIDPAYVAYMRENNIEPKTFKVEEFT